MLFLSAALSLVPIAADDVRLSAQGTFVSPAAQAALVDANGEVLCLDRPRQDSGRHICLTKQEWEKAIDLAERDASADRRDRQIGLSQWNSGANGSTKRY